MSTSHSVGPRPGRRGRVRAAEEPVLRDPRGLGPDRRVRWSQSTDRPSVDHRSKYFSSSISDDLLAQLDEVGPADRAPAGFGRRVGPAELSGRTAATGRTIMPAHELHAALDVEAVVVPPHRVEDLLAPHPLEAGDEVRVACTTRSARCAARPTPWAAACRSRRSRRGSSCGRTGRCRRWSHRARHFASRPSRVGLSGTASRGRRVVAGPGRPEVRTTVRVVGHAGGERNAGGAGVHRRAPVRRRRLADPHPLYHRVRARQPVISVPE